MSGSTYRAREDVHAQETSDGFLLCDATTQDIFELNGTARRIWELIVAEKPLEAMIGTLQDEYDAPADQIRECVIEMIEELVDQGLVKES